MRKTTYLPSYTVGEDAYKEVVNICKGYGKKVVFVGGKTALEKASYLVREELKGSDLEVLDELWYGGEASYENAKMLEQEKSVQEADMVFVFGGGKACDTCKILTENLKKPLFTFPTIAATCASITKVAAVYYPNGVFKEVFFRSAPAEILTENLKKPLFTFPTIAATCASITKVAAVYYPNGVFKEVFFRSAPAEHTFINTKIIAEAPEKYLWAGIGDTLAKGYEPEFSSRGKELDYSDDLGVTMSSLCKKSLVKYGQKALEDCKKNLPSKELERAVLAIIVTTGIVSNCLEMCYNSGVAHAVCYGFSTVKEVEENHLHGELVSYGVLVLLAMDKKYDEVKKLLPLYRSIDLPTSHRKFGLELNQMDGVFDKASSVKDIEVSAYDEVKKLLPLYRSIDLPTSHRKFGLELNQMDGVFDKASSVKDIEVSAYEVTREMIYKAVIDLEEYVAKN